MDLLGGEGGSRTGGMATVSMTTRLPVKAGAVKGLNKSFQTHWTILVSVNLVYLNMCYKPVKILTQLVVEVVR